MKEVKLKMEENGHGMFYIMQEDERIAEMNISIHKPVITASHTEVSPKAEGQGLGLLLFEELIKYTREHKLKLKPLCPFVFARLKKNPGKYADIWSQD